MEEGAAAIEAFNAETLRAEHTVTLSMLAPGEYRLQGVLYYCEASGEGQCLIAGVDVPVNVKNDGESNISIPLTPPAE